MDSRWKKGVVFAVLTGCVMAWLLIPPALLSAAKRKFTAGMTLQDAESQLKPPFYISTNAATLNVRSRYQILAGKNGLVLNFNEQEKLTSVESIFEHK